MSMADDVSLYCGMQAEAEQKAAVSAKEGLQKKLRDAEARVESLAETVEELRSGMARQQAAADLRCSLLPCLHLQISACAVLSMCVSAKYTACCAVSHRMLCSASLLLAYI